MYSCSLGAGCAAWVVIALTSTSLTVMPNSLVYVRYNLPHGVYASQVSRLSIVWADEHALVG